MTEKASTAPAAGSPEDKREIRAVARLTSFRLPTERSPRPHRKFYLAPVGVARHEYKAWWLREALGEVFEPGEEIAIISGASLDKMRAALLLALQELGTDDCSTTRAILDALGEPDPWVPSRGRAAP